MRGEIIGIISEGIEDQGVLKTILKAFDFDGSEVRFIRPDLSKDATDKHNNEKTIGTLQGVKNSCVGKDGERPDFENAFNLYDCNNIIIQMDTAEIEEQNFDIKRPKKENNLNYSKELRERVINLINNWLDNNFSDNLLYAISIEEIEAWCLTAFENKNTINTNNSKNKLQTYLDRGNLTSKKTKDKRDFFETITKKKGFHKKTKLKKFAQNNESLNDFIVSLEEKFDK